MEVWYKKKKATGQNKICVKILRLDKQWTDAGLGRHIDFLDLAWRLQTCRIDHSRTKSKNKQGVSTANYNS